MTQEVKDRTGGTCGMDDRQDHLESKAFRVAYSIGFTAESLFPDNPAQ